LIFRPGSTRAAERARYWLLPKPRNFVTPRFSENDKRKSTGHAQASERMRFNTLALQKYRAQHRPQGDQRGFPSSFCMPGNPR
jgi:hypothetical protein